MGKTTFLIGAAAGYVLGSRAGRERYEQIVQAANRFWENPTVQQKVGDVEERAAETAKTKGPQLQGKVSSALGSAKAKISGGSGESGDVPSTYETPTTSSPTFDASGTPASPYGSGSTYGTTTS
jgi:hypothetical protein